ncbi:cyclophilin-type peptidylprolyl cis-trans isomerase [Heterostelium album PN500]|uniref:peptidylprolyl isomerase n=1 Tax=Heterostelium pallidum (strain ATCC 26659 / Pp 5 / PN500) TaxID=670386 RepID=D3BCP9_HETP5|nr:cyclophilin-type peptidylprolyl cis-trans isomerase [Heterostelium album PN500]EFA80691.1 cyclophilin-type peptidylprolyl cis-trans isomerase [Heterostelium album PN500]|eukprot:XP_020432811.1 cyclophilin-type peptidylprolyl cis-trans isomerase [Heterostelium album PN500]
MKSTLCLLFVLIVSVFATAPETFDVVFQTSQGDFVLSLNRTWSPNGVDHLFDLVTAQYYDINYFFRVIQSPTPFVAQWGINGNPSVSQKWNITIPDDPVVVSNTVGTVAYAAEMNGNTACCRTTQLFINYGDNSFLDKSGFAPIGVITQGFSNTMKFFSGYGENPDQTLIYEQGNSYLEANFPKLDYISTARISPDFFIVTFQSSAGPFDITVNRTWAPNSADRFYELIQAGYYDSNYVYKVIDTPIPFIAQWGINGDPKITAQWNTSIENDPLVVSNTIATVAFAGDIVNNKVINRNTQIFINYRSNPQLDQYGYAPFGFISYALTNTYSFYNQYGNSPSEQLYIQYGNEFIEENYPKLDYIKGAAIQN